MRFLQVRHSLHLRWWLTSALILGALLIVLAAVASPAQAQEAPMPAPLAPPSALVGEPFYLQNCAPCHGETGGGDGPTAASLPKPPTVFADADVMWDLAPSTLFSTTKFGRIESLMPPWGNQMTDQQIWNTVAYAWSLHTSEDELRAGEAIYSAQCAACHGDGGTGDGAEATAPMPDFTDQAWAIEHSQADLLSAWLAAHGEIGADLTPVQQRQVLEYVRSFSMGTPWRPAYAPGSGSITGTVTQGTAGGGDVAGLIATLDAWLGQDRVQTLTTTVSSAGDFVFTNLSTDPNLGWIASVANQGVSYSSDFLALSPITPTLSGAITVYDTTDDASVLHVDRMNWIVETQPQTLTVGQIYAVGNSSDRTYVGERSDPTTFAPTFAMAVPAGATDIAFENGIVGGRFQQSGTTYYDTLPVAPGVASRQIILRFDYPYTGTTAEIAQPILYATGDLNLFVGDLPNLAVSAEPLAAQGAQEIGGAATYQLFNGAPIDPQTITVMLDGLLAEGEVDPRVSASAATAAPDQPSAPTSLNLPAAPLMPAWAIWLLASLVAVALAGVLLWALIFGGKRDARSQSNARESLLDRIALLDDLHAQGNLDDEAWQAERTRLKQELRATGEKQ